MLDVLTTTLSNGVRSRLRTTSVRLGASVARIDRRYLNSASLAANLRTILTAHSVDCVIDAGAHHGEFVQFLRQCVGYKGLIRSFEPSPATFERLTRRWARDPRWKGYQVALGESDRTGQLLTHRETVFDSFLETSPSAIEHYGDQVDGAQTLTVPIRRLDRFVPEAAPELAGKRLFLKMDTQGFDKEVYRGSSGLLSQIVGLQSELAVVALYVGVDDFVDLLSEYRRDGFEVSGMYPVNRDEQDLRVIEFDGLMVRANA